jgi:hypothetical protein
LVAAITRTSVRRLRVPAHAFEFALLQYSQQLRLSLERQLACLVKKQRAAVGEFKTAPALLSGASKCAFLVAEQLAFYEIAGQARTIDLDQRPLAAWTAFVDRARDQFFSGAGLALISTVLAVGATCAIWAMTRRNAGDSPIIASRSERISSTRYSIVDRDRWVCLDSRCAMRYACRPAPASSSGSKGLVT